MDKHLAEHLNDPEFPITHAAECGACEDRLLEYAQEGWLQVKTNN